MPADCFTSDLQTLSQAKAHIEKLLPKAVDVEIIRFDQAMGRVLAHNIASPINVPAFDNSAMDGYAFRYQDIDTTEQFKVIGKSLAGSPFIGQVNIGECVRITTGAAIPDDCDCVQMQENTKNENNHLVLLKKPKLGQAIRLAGEDIAKNKVILHKGRLIKASDIGLIASLGLSEISVYKPLTVAIFSTGDELLTPGEAHQTAAVYDSNRPAIKALLEKMQYNVIDLGKVADNKQCIRDVLLEADRLADCVITSGGVSVGEADFVKEIVNDIGHVDFWKIAIKPGKPLAFGRLVNSIFIGLPGNPVSAFVTFHKIAADALRKMSGAVINQPILIPAKAAQAIRKRPGRTDFQRGCYYIEDGNLLVRLEKAQGSGVFSSFYSSNCFVVLEQERGDVAVGENVMIEPFDALLQ
ncbi:molybdopterin molybdotransferase MoeA [Glaciecola petra]|uniref:Molybdopterin molybdenumtransferase n=1 Tax=Glaciecola petra TaxID=3075602 RepID=A0ABU2ZQN4_9ALTE|nr:gephyrin-like molybdotransferase Glp [Aestuariibacter sp. P117]MDT0594696.1 molybdopterin molybdotransferase MoeA [Aestuariibacter sp. P117]